MIILEASKGMLFSIVKHFSGAAVGADNEAVVTRTSRYAAYVVGEVLKGSQMAFALHFNTRTYSSTPSSVQNDPDRSIT